MPAKIKWVWISCCLIVFFGFIYMAMKVEIHEAKLKSRQDRIEQAKQRVPPAKKFQEKAFQVSRMIKDIREFIALGKYKEAADLARQVIDKDPENAKAFTWWGISLVKMQQLDEAIVKFVKSSQLDPGQPRTFLYWGLTLSMQAKYPEAIAKYKTAIQLDPENSNAYAYWGGALANIKDYKEAAVQLKKSLNINPFNQVAFGVLVDTYYHTRQYRQAWKIVSKARKQNVTIADETLSRLAAAMPEPSS